jgi:acetyl esterase/lipase
MTSFRRSAAEGRSDLPAELTLRFGAERLPGRVYWPAAISAPPLIFLLGDARDGDEFSPSLCSAATAVVLSMPTRADSNESIEVAALAWAADHASELGATARLLLAGVYLGGGHAARLATAARDRGWPPLHRQLVVHPMFDAACPIPSRLDGAAPATIVTADGQGTRYAARLRAVGIDVEELHVRDRSLPRGAELAELVRSLGLSPPMTSQLTDGPIRRENTKGDTNELY